MVLVEGFTATARGALPTETDVIPTIPALLVAFATIVCGSEASTSVVNDHDVVPIASENAPESTDTSTFCIPDGSDAVPVTVIEPVPRTAPLEGDVIVTFVGDFAPAVLLKRL